MIYEMWMVPVGIAGLLGIGAIGGWALGRFVPRGWWRRALMLLWVLAPFLYLIAAMALDPICSGGGNDLGNQLSCDESAAFILVMFFGFGPPWAIAIFAGALFGWGRREA